MTPRNYVFVPVEIIDLIFLIIGSRLLFFGTWKPGCVWCWRWTWSPDSPAFASGVAGFTGPMALSPHFMCCCRRNSPWCDWLAIPLKLNCQHICISFSYASCYVFPVFFFFFYGVLMCFDGARLCHSLKKTFFFVQINRSPRSVCHIWLLSNNPVISEYFIPLAVNH